MLDGAHAIRLASAGLAGLFTAAAASGAATPDSLQMYVCTVNGHRYSGQSPPDECRNVEIRVLNGDGSEHTIIPAPMTEAQRQRKAEQDRQKRQEEDAERARLSKDRSLLETYSTVEEIEAARQRALAGQRTLIQRAEEKIAQYRKEKKRLDDEAEFYAKRAMPPKLKEQFDNNRALTEQQEKSRDVANSEMARINERFDGDRHRFEELEKQAEQAARTRRAAEESAGR